MASVLREGLSGGPRNPVTKEWTKRVLVIAAGTYQATPVQVVDPTFPDGVWLDRVLPRRSDVRIVDGKPDQRGRRPVVLLPDGDTHAWIYPLGRHVEIS
jgi:hypothetical protein